jgi:hypothetical protein
MSCSEQDAGHHKFNKPETLKSNIYVNGRRTDTNMQLANRIMKKKPQEQNIVTHKMWIYDKGRNTLRAKIHRHTKRQL